MKFSVSKMTFLFLAAAMAYFPFSQPEGITNPSSGEKGGFNHDGAFHDEDSAIDRKIYQAFERGGSMAENPDAQMAGVGAVTGDSDAKEAILSVVGPEGSGKHQIRERVLQSAGPPVSEQEVIAPESPALPLPNDPAGSEETFEEEPEPEVEQETPVPVKEKPRKISGMRYV